jgi:hypothetical protein
MTLITSRLDLKYAVREAYRHVIFPTGFKVSYFVQKVRNTQTYLLMFMMRYGLQISACEYTQFEPGL